MSRPAPAPARDDAAALDRAAERLSAVLAAAAAASHAGPGEPQDTPPRAPRPAYDGGADTPPALQRLAHAFGLSAFERDLLLLATLLERHGALGEAMPPGGRATFALAASVLAGPERQALAPAAALRRWRLLEPDPEPPIERAPLRVDERVRFYLEGQNSLDPRLDGLVRPLRARPRDEPAAWARIAAALQGRRSPAECPVLVVLDPRVGRRQAFVAAAAQALGRRLFVLDAADVPPQPAEREALARLWEREAMLLDAALLIECDQAPAESLPRLQALLESLEALVFVSCRSRFASRGRPLLNCELPGIVPADELARWQGALGGALAQRLNGTVERTAMQFRLDDDGLREAAAAAAQAPDAAAADALWDSARVQARCGLDRLAERIDARAGWADLVLPEAQLAVLRQIALQVRERDRVHRLWGFADKSARGLGIAALFAGGSGTGKTLAAEVLANALRLDLYRVDLARLVSKYIGETEKNLAQVFDAAEEGGAIVLFDEADALFGRRSEVRDSHDRYANIEVSYLLQRVETYRGLSILTTNLKQSLDPAFTRRIRFVVSFPFPDAPARQAIWGQVFPAAMPRSGLDLAKLARLNLAGGHIRNIALNAAFLAAGRGEPVGMGHLRSAAEAEYAKLEKPLSRQDVGDWA